MPSTHDDTLAQTSTLTDWAAVTMSNVSPYGNNTITWGEPETLRPPELLSGYNIAAIPKDFMYKFHVANFSWDETSEGDLNLIMEILIGTENTGRWVTTRKGWAGSRESLIATVDFLNMSMAECKYLNSDRTVDYSAPRRR